MFGRREPELDSRWTGDGGGGICVVVYEHKCFATF